MRPLRTFQRKLLVFFVGLYALTQMFAFLAADTAYRRNVRGHINDELNEGGRVFDKVIENRSERFLLAAHVMSSDFGFKTAFGSGDRRTMIAVMKNHGARIKADLVLLVSHDCRVVACTRHREGKDEAFPFPRMVATAERTGRASAMAYFEEGLYRFVVVPLRAPTPVAWVVAGFRIDDELARELKMLTSLDVTFVAGTDKGTLPVTVASSLEGRKREAFRDALHSAVWEGGGYADLVLQGERFMGLSRDLGMQGDSQVTVFLQQSLDAALQPFYRLRNRVALLFAGVLAVMFAGGVLIARRITSPIRMLVDSARSIEQGDYTHVLPVDSRQDDLGRLSHAFNLMQDAIRQREERIRYHAYYDMLTNLANRSWMYQRLTAEIAAAREQGRSLALIIMNIDRFNEVVATLGHEAGKCILQSMAPLLKKVAPEPALVARFGGDIFAVMLAGGADAQDAVRVAQEIRKELERSVWVGDAPVQIEARFGVVAYPDHGNDADSLLRLGDVAVHLAKGSPSGSVVYSSELDRHSRRRLTLLAELRRAMEHDELMLFYQPKVDFETRRVVGVEALIRWKHAQHGFVAPDEFVGLAEGTGMIVPVTAWTLRTAIRQCAELNRHGISLNMGINLSARVLPDQQLPDMIKSLFRDHRVDAGQVTFEVTESAIMTEPARTIDVVNRLDAAGALLCVDDFGTGYSSLSYLKQLPVDELKIDKSFVQAMDTNQNDEIIVRSIIELGHNLGLRVTAEGVENRQVWDMLRDRGCDVAQGYLHGRPMPLDELIAWSRSSPWGLGSGEAGGAGPG